MLAIEYINILINHYKGKLVNNYYAIIIDDNIFHINEQMTWIYCANIACVREISNTETLNEFLNCNDNIANLLGKQYRLMKINTFLI